MSKNSTNSLVRLLFENTHTCHVFLCPNLTILGANPRFTELFGLSLDQAAGKSILNYVADSELFSKALDSKLPCQLKSQTIQINQESCVLDIFLDPVFDDNGELDCLICSLNEVSDLGQELQKTIDGSQITAEIPGAVFQLLIQTNGELEIPFMSEGFERITGIPSAQVMANPAVAFAAILPEDLASVRQSIFQGTEELKENVTEFRMQIKDGPVKWFQTRTLPHRLENGAILKQGVMLDITQQKNATLQLQAYRSQLESYVSERTAKISEQAQIIKQIHEAIITLDTEGNISSWNPGAEQILGFMAKEVLGIPATEVFPSLENKLSPNKLLSPEITLRKKDGSDFHALLSLSQMKDETGRSKGIIACISDISERKLAERTNEEARRYFQSLDRISRILSASETDLDIALYDVLLALLEIFGAERAWLLHPLDPDSPSFQIQVEATHPDYPGIFELKKDIHNNDIFQGIAKQTLASPHPVIMDFPGEGVSTGGIKPVLSQMVMSLFPHHDKPWMLGLHQCRHRTKWSTEEQRLFQDIGIRIGDTLSTRLLLQRLEQELIKRTKTEQELIIAKTTAEQANHAKSEFLSSMSHELRTPMNAILGFAQILAMENDKEQSELAREIVVAGNHLMAIINDILDLEKIEAGSITINKENLSLRHLIEECQRLITPTATLRKIKFTISEESQINICIYADRTRLKQVLLNLLTNGIKYNKPNGDLVLSCHKIGDTLEISVADTGFGISEKRQKELFTAFERFGAEKTNIEGTGIGLVITKSLVELMGGTIRVESTEGEGSTFYIRLPLTNPVKEHTEESFDLS